jgi:Family of unknown function (DUF6064)
LIQVKTQAPAAFNIWPQRKEVGAMSLPFTVEQFFQVFAAYNTAIWPVQILAYILALVALVLSYSRSSWAGRAASGILGVFWIWIGVVYHIMYFRTVNPAAVGFGVFFVLQGLLFLLAGSIRGKLSFALTARPAPVVGAILIFYAMVGYPLLSSALGHSYPATPTFGLTPCPTTIFTFGLLLWTVPATPRYLLIIPFIWAIVGTSAAVQLDVQADYGLAIAAVAGVLAAVLGSNAGKPGVAHPA